MMGPHPTHQTRFSDASTFDEICVKCGATDQVPGGWGRLALPCPKPTMIYQIEGEFVSEEQYRHYLAEHVRTGMEE